jgi:hypothetical protein
MDNQLRCFEQKMKDVFWGTEVLLWVFNAIKRVKNAKG